MSTPLEPTGSLEPTGAETVENAIELKDVEGLSQGQIVRRRFFRHRGALGGLLTILLVALLAYSSIGAFGIPGWWRFDHLTLGEVQNGGSPSLSIPGLFGADTLSVGDHPFGQDEIGRDIFARTMKGTQTSLNVMIIISLLAALIGMAIGAVAGYFRGWVDELLMRFTDLFITFPVIVIGAVLGNFAGSAGAFWLAVALGAITWTTLARLVRGEFLTLREREFVDAAKVAGASSFRIMRKHMIPNAMGVIIVNTTLLASQAVLLETALSYLGFGVKSPDVSLGTMISEYQSAFSTRPWLFWWPGLLIVLIALSVNFIGDGLRDAFDPRQKRIPSARAMAKAANAETVPASPSPSTDGNER